MNERSSETTPQRRVWIAQCLCPQRHCILATAGEADSESAAEETIAKPLRAQVGELLELATLNPWCGLCNAPTETWRYELGRTPFHSVEEAMPKLQQIEAEQRATAALWGDLPRSD